MNLFAGTAAITGLFSTFTWSDLQQNLYMIE